MILFIPSDAAEYELVQSPEEDCEIAQMKI